MATLARAAGRSLANATRGLLSSGEAAAARTARVQRRGFASEGGHGHHDSVTHEGLTIPKAAKWHVYAGQGFAGLMWFWVFYRFYHDFDTFVYGHAAHFDHELEHEAEHGNGEEHH